MRLFIALGILLFINIACTSESETQQSTPEATAKGLFEALKAEDFEKAKRYGTKSTQESLLHFVTNLNMVGPEKKEALMSPYKMEVSEVACVETNGTTTCKLCCHPEFDAVELIMIERDQQWFAQTEFHF